MRPSTNNDATGHLALLLSALAILVSSTGCARSDDGLSSRASALGLSTAELRRWDDPASVEDRELVAENLRESKVLVAKTRAEVIRLLGPPQTTNGGKSFQLNYVVGVVAADYVFMNVILDGDIVTAVTVTSD